MFLAKFERLAFAVEGVGHGRDGGRRDGDVFRALGEGEESFHIRGDSTLTYMFVFSVCQQQHGQSGCEGAEPERSEDGHLFVGKYALYPNADFCTSESGSEKRAAFRTVQKRRCVSFLFFDRFPAQNFFVAGKFDIFGEFFQKQPRKGIEPMHGGAEECKHAPKVVAAFYVRPFMFKHGVNVPLRIIRGQDYSRAEYAVNGGCRDLFADKNIAFYTLCVFQFDNRCEIQRKKRYRYRGGDDRPHDRRYPENICENVFFINDGNNGLRCMSAVHRRKTDMTRSDCRRVYKTF